MLHLQILTHSWIINPYSEGGVVCSSKVITIIICYISLYYLKTTDFFFFSLLESSWVVSDSDGKPCFNPFPCRVFDSCFTRGLSLIKVEKATENTLKCFTERMDLARKMKNIVL